MASFILSVSFLVGASLGARYKVFVLVPTTYIAAVVATVAGVELGYYFWSLLLFVLLAVTAMQLGYVIGMIARQLLRRHRLVSPQAGAAAVFRVPNL